MVVGRGGEEDGRRTMSAKVGRVWNGLKGLVCGGGELCLSAG